MLPKAHKTISVTVQAEENETHLRGPEARGFVRMFKQGIGKGTAPVGKVVIVHEDGESEFPLHSDGSLRLKDGSAHGVLGLPAWLREVKEGKEPTWPPKATK